MTLADQNRALKAALKAARPYVWAAAHDPANSVAIARLAIIDAALAAEPASGEADNRRLAALLKEARSQIHGDCWIREDLQRRIDAALAAEPASGEANDEPSEALLERGREQALQMLEVSRAGYERGHADALKLVTETATGRAPPPPPTQGEEDTARQIWQGNHDSNVIVSAIAAALRQRADEATRAENEECALIADERLHMPNEKRRAFSQGDRCAAAFIAAAIRARITIDHNG